MQETTYTILLFPDPETTRMIEEFRLQYFGDRLIDGLPPHITIKRRFKFIQKIQVMEAIPKLLSSCSLGDRNFSNGGIKILGDALCLSMNNPGLKSLHLKLYEELDGLIITLKPEFEGNAFVPHMTILRMDASMNKGVLQNEAEILFLKGEIETIGFFELKGKDYAKEIISIDLKSH